jgi:Zn-dependent peptidase ImmA (M78 family)
MHGVLHFLLHKREEVGPYRCKSVRKHEHAIITAATLCMCVDALSAELIVFQLSHGARAKIRFSVCQHAIAAPAIVCDFIDGARGAIK